MTQSLSEEDEIQDGDLAFHNSSSVEQGNLTALLDLSKVIIMFRSARVIGVSCDLHTGRSISSTEPFWFNSSPEGLHEVTDCSSTFIKNRGFKFSLI